MKFEVGQLWVDGTDAVYRIEAIGFDEVIGRCLRNGKDPLGASVGNKIHYDGAGRWMHTARRYDLVKEIKP